MGIGRDDAEVRELVGGEVIDRHHDGGDMNV